MDSIERLKNSQDLDTYSFNSFINIPNKENES